MKINLTDAEKTALANYLAEKEVQRIKDAWKSEFEIEPLPGMFEQEFKYYQDILKETDDY